MFLAFRTSLTRLCACELVATNSGEGKSLRSSKIASRNFLSRLRLYRSVKTLRELFLLCSVITITALNRTDKHFLAIIRFYFSTMDIASHEGACT